MSGEALDGSILVAMAHQVCLYICSDNVFSPRHLRSLLSAGGWFFVWSFVVLFVSCRVVCCCSGVLVVSCVVLFLLCVCVC